MHSEAEIAVEQASPAWSPLSPTDRRVVGVLIEKGKTTPDAYPLSVNAVRTGCNQKSNRAPTMQLTEDEIEDSLQHLRQVGAVTCVQGSGRIERYRHEMYRWLGVDKIELAVMAELLLRGAQTEGELRGRAARMDPIADLGALRPVLESLKSKGLVIPLNPAGRGHAVTHALYPPEELQKIKSQFGSASDIPAESTTPVVRDRNESQRSPSKTPQPSSSSTFETLPREVIEFRQELERTRAQLAQLREEVNELRVAHSEVVDELRQLNQSLGN